MSPVQSFDVLIKLMSMPTPKHERKPKQRCLKVSTQHGHGFFATSEPAVAKPKNISPAASLAPPPPPPSSDGLLAAPKKEAIAGGA